MSLPRISQAYIPEEESTNLPTPSSYSDDVKDRDGALAMKVKTLGQDQALVESRSGFLLRSKVSMDKK